ncbi:MULTISPECIES: LuxR C-terminal-related transcriptional regulator [Microbulbifer]|uniref:LuxR C-terminal-related transcriptional regulator n=1 Tax=Microbulbifer TaxID=48073 RepID=UPI001CD31036|nr:LuxR C-terminal-related transcriptional regulator [Microbulbifer agarilyticus]MCA0899926.1 LuxR C-terminal-related transcriptional regulator [Microbulbifer agarilyticus]
MATEEKEKAPDTGMLTEVWEQSDNVFAKGKTDLSRVPVDELVGRVFSNGPHYHYVFDLFDQELVYVSPLVEQVHDLKIGDMTFQSILDQIHPEDMDFVASAEATAIRLLQERIGMDKVTSYKVSYCFRFRAKGGEYRLFNHQSLVLDTDSHGRISKALNVHTDISHLTTKNNYRLSLIGMDGEPSFINLEVDNYSKAEQSNRPSFTERELSVIRLVSKGLTSAQIGEALSLSEYTIKNHRKRILKKAGCQNMSQLLANCVGEGVI